MSPQLPNRWLYVRPVLPTHKVHLSYSVQAMYAADKAYDTTAWCNCTSARPCMLRRFCFLSLLVASLDLPWIDLSLRRTNVAANTNVGGGSKGGFGAARTYLTWSSLPEEHTMLREMCRSFADNELAPNAGEWDKNHTFPKDQVRQAD